MDECFGCGAVGGVLRFLRGGCDVRSVAEHPIDVQKQLVYLAPAIFLPGPWQHARVGVRKKVNLVTQIRRSLHW